MSFQTEAEFEEALIKILTEKGWEKQVLKHYTEKQLLQNWADILFENNRSRDRLNNYPLTEGEMQQIVEQINMLRTPIKLNGFINGKTVSIKRDHPEDTEHLGKEVSLKIYDRMEIAAGQSRYQIVQQPKFESKSPILNSRRGDLMLLINGMPVFHIELKKSGIPLSQAYYQIEKYSGEGLFTGLFSLIQIFVAMTPDEAVYFANPGNNGIFNKDYYFRWADFNNEPISDWKSIASSLLSIPMAHQLIGFYTVADNSDGILKVMRSYQYYAANAISDVVSKTKWDSGNQRGGFVWHTTGSGKTMTSFKSAQLISHSNDADKVVFLTDRIELGTQSLAEYQNFADDNETVQGTENSYVLLKRLESNAPADTLIVTSIQKMSQLHAEDDSAYPHIIEKINRKRIVFIVDEAHRSTFGEMLFTIKKTYPNAIFFGFTGTPVFDENAKKQSAQTDVFGNELHRYSIADGIRDKNVLGFDTYKILTYKDRDIRSAVALSETNAASDTEAIADPAKSKLYYKYMDPSQTKMYGYLDESGKYVKGIEDYLTGAQYQRAEHQNMVVQDILENWKTFSHDSKFHAIFATSSIPEAIEYYRLIKEKGTDLKVTCLFDPHIENTENWKYKEDGLVEIVEDYNKRYDQDFTLANHGKFKKDIALRLSHKGHYKAIASDKNLQLDLLIVVDQMLTGFDSKWVNTLYLDKILEYENIIQAFSRTNRLAGVDKPFGVIRYYRKPHTMEQYIDKAVKLYSGDKPLGLFVQKLPYHIRKMNECYQEIKELFEKAKVANYERLPYDVSVKAKFALCFNQLNEYLESAKVQGFTWEQTEYCGAPEDSAAEDFTNEDFVAGDSALMDSVAEGSETFLISLSFAQNEYNTLLQRYKELAKDGDGGGKTDAIPYDIAGHLMEYDTRRIDADYMNSRFQKYLKILKQGGESDVLLEDALGELHKSFAVLSQEDQKFAVIFLHDIERGDVVFDENKTFMDYISEYKQRAGTEEILKISDALGLDQNILTEMMALNLNADNINEFGRFDKLKDSVDKTRAKKFLEEQLETTLSMAEVNKRIYRVLKAFVLTGKFSIS